MSIVLSCNKNSPPRVLMKFNFTVKMAKCPICRADITMTLRFY